VPKTGVHTCPVEKGQFSSGKPSWYLFPAPFLVSLRKGVKRDGYIRKGKNTRITYNLYRKMRNEWV